ncbi:MAG: mandelate racemase/muconate lactonizing enzyme family protein [Chloroflexota bacterium]
MKITKISVYQVDLAYPGGTYHLSKGRTYTSFDDTIVAVETDAGIVGWGETCPFGSTYVEASVQGARAAIGLMTPHLIGQDPRRPEPLYGLMDGLLVGHGYAKSALDMAFWDILGKAARLPLCDLWGGRVDEPLTVKTSFGLSATAWEGDIATRIKEEVARFKQGKGRTLSIKATSSVARDIEILGLISDELDDDYTLWIDADSGWRFADALKVGLAMQGRNIVFEQPCATYEECRQLRQRIPQSIMLDEVAVDMETAVRAYNDGLLDHYNLKTARVGGLTKARKIRDMLAELGVPIHFQCTWGAELGTAGMLHLAQSTPERSRTDFWHMASSSTIVATANGLPQPVDGQIEASRESGLGIEPRMVILGEPVAVYV